MWHLACNLAAQGSVLPWPHHTAPFLSTCLLRVSMARHVVLDEVGQKDQKEDIKLTVE